MRWSRSLIPTLKEVPAEAEAKSHVLMLRGGLIRKLGSGVYSYLPAGFRVIRKISAIVREEMDRAGAAEVLLPALWPAEVLEESGRMEVFGADVIRFRDRHNRQGVLAPTHEEVITALVRDNVTSYKQLPLTLYQIQTKFRDEVRPRFGVLRTREFVMKDAYSFDAGPDGLKKSYEAMYGAYCRIFDRCGLDYVVVEAESGAMGGSRSQEFMVRSDIGDDKYVQCPSCGHAANVEKAAIGAGPGEKSVEGDGEPGGGPGEVSTPGARTIDEVAACLDTEPNRMIKTLLYVADGRPVAALVRGDHDVNENKLARVVGADELVPGDADMIENVTGAPVGFAGPVGLSGVDIIADRSVMQVTDAVTGANKADTHLTGVEPARDFRPEKIGDIRAAVDSDPCPRCNQPMGLHHGIEVGHVFQLGTKYSGRLGAEFLDESGRRRPYIMGCYGIGINRIAAAAVETFADEHGMVWPPGIAPHQVAVLCLNTAKPALADASQRVYEQLLADGLDVLLDDRDARPGSKFKDADLLGFPVKVIVGRGYEKNGMFEVQVRKSGEQKDVAEDELAGEIHNIIERL